MIEIGVLKDLKGIRTGAGMALMFKREWKIRPKKDMGFLPSPVPAPQA